MATDPYQEVLSGEVFTARFFIDDDSNYDQESPLFSIFCEQRSSIEEELNRIAKNILGPEFELYGLTIRQGSVEIIASIGTAICTISSYDNLVKSINLFVNQARKLFRRWSPPKAANVAGTWHSSPALQQLQLPQKGARFRRDRIGGYLVAYVVLTHFILLAVAIYLLLVK